MITCSPNFNFCVILDLQRFWPTKLGKGFISDWSEVGQTVIDILWRRDGIKPFGRLKRQYYPTFLAGVVFKTQCYCKFARHILRKQTKDFWYFKNKSRKPTCLMKQPGQGNVVTPFLPNELKNAEKTTHVRNAWPFIWRFSRFNLC